MIKSFHFLLIGDGADFLGSAALVTVTLLLDAIILAW